MAVLYVLRLGDEKKLFGVSVHRRVGGAVKRNRVKRLFRESFRRIMGEIPAGSRMLFLVRANASDRSFVEIYNAVRELAMKAGLVKER